MTLNLLQLSDFEFRVSGFGFRVSRLGKSPWPFASLRLDVTSLRPKRTELKVDFENLQLFLQESCAHCPRGTSSWVEYSSCSATSEASLSARPMLTSGQVPLGRFALPLPLQHPAC